MSSAATIFAVVGGVLVVILGIAVLRLRGQTRTPAAAPVPERSLTEAVDAMRRRMDELADDLSEALDRAEREGRRTRLLGELGSSLDLDDVLDRILDEALGIPGFDAGMISIRQTGRPQRVETRGLSPEEAADLPSAAGSSAPASTITVSYRFGPNVTDEGQVIRGGVFVPVNGRESETLGTLAVFWRRGGWEPSPDDVETLEQLARSAAGPIENARRYHEARELAETDALTGLHNQRYFHDALGKEVLRAQRYDRQLALIVLDIDDFKSINDTMGHLAGDAVLAQVAERIRETVRTVDVACRIGGDEFAVILPESRSGDSEQLFDRLRQLLSGTSFGPAGRGLRVSAGVGELRAGDSAAALFHRADAALLRAKELGKDRVESDTDRNGGKLPAWDPDR